MKLVLDQGMPRRATIVLHEAGLRWSKDRSWCETGRAVRKRKRGTVTVQDPDAAPKKT